MAVNVSQSNKSRVALEKSENGSKKSITGPSAHQLQNSTRNDVMGSNMSGANSVKTMQ